MVSLKLRNLDLVLSRHKHTAYEKPGDLSRLPPEDGPAPRGLNGGGGADEDVPMEEDPGRTSESEAEHVMADAFDEDVEACRDVGKEDGKFPSFTAQRCGALPSTSSLSDYLSFAIKQKSRSAEARYANEYVATCINVFGEDDRFDPMLVDASDACYYVSPEEAAAAAGMQQQYFKDVDAYKLDDCQDSTTSTPAGAPQRPPRSRESVREVAFTGAIRSLPPIVPSRTVVMEAAFHLLRSGMLTIPDVGGMNVKASRAFSHDGRLVAALHAAAVVRVRRDGRGGCAGV